MTTAQKIIKYVALALALSLCVGIITGIFSGILAVSRFLDTEPATEEMQEYTVKNSIKNLTIDIDASRLEIKNGDCFKVESNHKYIKCTEDGNSLNVEETESSFSKYSDDVKIIITIPEKTEFEKVTISTGAGALKIDEIVTDSLKLSLGAGQMKANRLVALNKTVIDGGAGQIIVKNAVLNNADIDLGVGELDFQGSLTGDCEIDSGVGAVTLDLEDELSSYTFEADKGLGEITVDGKKLVDNEIHGTGNNRIELSNGVGEIKVILLSPQD